MCYFYQQQEGTHTPVCGHTPAHGAHTYLRRTHLPAVHTPALCTWTWCICALGHCVKHEAVLRLRASGCVWKYIVMAEGCVRSPPGVHPRVLSTLSLAGLKTAGYARPSGWCSPGFHLLFLSRAGGMVTWHHTAFLCCFQAPNPFTLEPPASSSYLFSLGILGC